MKKVMNNKKGFTLIEIIVVLVILAILAAATVPSMIGFVNDARGKAYVAEARVGLVAAQAYVSEQMAAGKVRPGSAAILGSDTFKNMTAEDLDGAFTLVTFESDDSDEVGYSRVGGITYTTTNGWVIKIDKGTTTVSKP